MMEPSFWGKSETDGATLHPKGDGVVRRRRHQTNTIALSAGVPKRKLAFAYDGQSRRISKKVMDWNVANSDWSLTLERRFVYDGWNMVAEVDGSGNLVKSHTWGLDLSKSQQGAGGVGGLLWTHDAASSQTHFMAYDGNGNVTALVRADTTNTISARYDYNAFGETVLQEGDGSSSSNPYRFSTKYQDEETGLYYYGYRYYQPEAGRWLNRDPLGEEGGLNLNCIVVNNLINYSDYLGLDQSYTGKLDISFGVMVVYNGSLEYDLTFGDGGCNKGSITVQLGAGFGAAAKARFGKVGGGLELIVIGANNSGTISWDTTNGGGSITVSDDIINLQKSGSLGVDFLSYAGLSYDYDFQIGVKLEARITTYAVHATLSGSGHAKVDVSTFINIGKIKYGNPSGFSLLNENLNKPILWEKIFRIPG